MAHQLSLPELAMSRVEQDLRDNLDDLRRTEEELKLDSSNELLLKKYEALLRDKHILLEGRNDSISEGLNHLDDIEMSLWSHHAEASYWCHLKLAFTARWSGFPPTVTVLKQFEK